MSKGGVVPSPALVKGQIIYLYPWILGFTKCFLRIGSHVLTMISAIWLHNQPPGFRYLLALSAPWLNQKGEWWVPEVLCCPVRHYLPLPATPGFFFVSNEVGSLHLCIEYVVVSDIILKNSYLISLIFVDLDLLHGVKVRYHSGAPYMRPWGQ